MHRMAPIQDLDHPRRLQPHLGRHPIQSRPDPRRPIRREGHHPGPRRARAMEVEGQQLDQRIGTAERAIDDRPRSLGHPALLVGLEDDQQLGLAPLHLEGLALDPATDAHLLDHRPHPHSAAVDRRSDSLVLEPVAGWEFAAAEPQQVAGAGGQHLRPQFVGDPPDRLLVRLQPAPGQFGAGLLDRQEGDLPAHLGLDIGAAPLADPIGGQLGIEPASLAASPFAGAGAGGAIQGHHRDRQPAQKSDHQRALFFSAGRSGTSAAAVTAATCSAISGRSPALASSPAT